jgi:hypothetical protein
MVRHAASMGELGDTHNILVGNFDEKSHLRGRRVDESVIT